LHFSDAQLERYARHIVLKEVGGAGQQRLLNAKVLVVGAGGLGSPAILYLAAAGVGTIGVVDDDQVSLSNLQRQIAHTAARIGQPKTASAAAAVQALNSDVRLVEHQVRLDAKNAVALIRNYDIVADGSDNFATRFLVNDACFLERKVLVSAAMLQFEGQLSTFKAHQAGEHPCYRCLFPEPPPPGLAPSCSEAGVLGALAGTMGSLQATEVLKEIVAIGDSMSGRLLIYDALATRFRTVRVKRDPQCRLCGPQATIHDLSLHAA
jgi:adenylyltransferase/sulfurtransferase